MKSYTDLEQSKKLSEFLPIESADMYWLNWHIDLTDSKYEVFVIDKSNKYIDFFNSYAVAVDNNEIIPCWSLAALLGVIPVTAEYKGMFIRLRIDKGHIGHDEYAMWYDDLQTNLSTDIEAEADNFVDACYGFILKLHELKIL